ncbi:hypothetical protein SAY86_024384 [Trapa natans]|uniref:Pseudouridine synthase RsuA/RluA-like domain-containing protein n=1 Tax=Trapa natans TaxID=22666 RepID=A0AAN7M6L8_TRANT|nr:hypothetical protein SAY86_024384 [Trapa natans]
MYFADGTSLVGENRSTKEECKSIRKILKVCHALVVGILDQDEVEIQSGRPHQIRIHLSFIGHPLLGDHLYVNGGQSRYFDPEYADENVAHDGSYQRPENPVPGVCDYFLHALQLVFHHPFSEEVIKITAPLPSVFQTDEEANIH